MVRYRLSAAAQTDLIDILAWTHKHFADVARERYEALLVAVLRDVSSQPDRPGSLERPELGEGVRSWHLHLSRECVRTGTGIVRRPRHFLIYRTDRDMIVVGRVLHDAMELARHLDPEESWE
ncbi:type II toxin-antitoxin system RelE/ParE family toxin [Verminephrobacter eiseniae]|uniref:type II toxin-antitoxin system RelE/ParE family toxin n=1 Tax=Verminephrobacter eiseniae TaxID=364317 RepID=UPI0022389E9E|nr:type II toxin-antitoxin system RelE/ParE family toxin [Verminephrobacter eiseniae]MCW5237166.1 type II toxin-antitoxin system RelE/ParE family toxin [Verminephrobacter eiseniae]